MLEFKERRWVLWCLRFLCIGNCFPAEVDTKAWEVRPGRAKRLIEWGCYLYYTLVILHAMYTTGRLFHVILFLPDQVPLTQLVIHGELAGAYVITAVYWYYELFLRNADAYAGFIRITLTGDMNGSRHSSIPSGENDSEPAGFLHRLRKYSLQDLIAIFLPFMIHSSEVAITACFIYDPTIKLLLYSAVPEDYQTWWSFVICLIEEFRLQLFTAGLMVTTWQIQVVAFEFISSSLQGLTESILNTRELRSIHLETAYKSLRHLQLYVTVLNTCSHNVIFTWKVLALGFGIFSGYAAIANLKDQPIFGVMHLVIFLDSVLTYAIIYGKAFKVPELFEEAKGAVRLRSRQVNRARMKLLARQMRSVPPVGIQVGRFNMLERTSTPVFLDFVLGNVISMLVAYG